MAKNIYGGGAQTNINGLAFERDVSLNKALEKAGFKLKKHNPEDQSTCVVWDVYEDDTLIGFSAPKNALNKLLESRYGVEMSSILSKKLQPDEAFMNIRSKRLSIIEKKWQEQSGSVDEKLQTCDFKRREYKKLQKAANNSEFEDVDYMYVLSPWFEQKQYNDVKEYIRDVGCDYFMGEIPMKKLGL